MKYNKIYICGHPKSGVRYVSKLIHENFFTENKEFYKDADEIQIDNDTLYVYVERRFRNLIKSFYEIRHIYGISEDMNFEDFYKTKYSQSCFENTNYDCRHITMPPRNYWEHHVNSWIKICKVNTNIIMISYDKILRNMDVVMKKIGSYL